MRAPNEVIEIAAARSSADVAAVKALILAYAEFLKVDLCFQSFAEEMATFPAFYDLLLLAKVGGAPAACVALKNLGGDVCEMKRLFAYPEHRGLKLGETLSMRLIAEARERGFRVMRLDSLKRLGHALALYRRLGFVETPAYYDNPLPEVVFMELRL